MRKLRGLQTLSVLREGGGGIASHHALQVLWESRGSGCALVFPLTRLYMCAVIRLSCILFQHQESGLITETESHQR